MTGQENQFVARIPHFPAPTPAEALDQLKFMLISANIPTSLNFNPLAYSCLCCGAKGGYDTMAHLARCPLRVLGEAIAGPKVASAATTLLPSEVSTLPLPTLIAAPASPVPPAYALNTRVTWTEGRTARVRSGVIEYAYQSTGWPAEYHVRPLKLDGTPAAQLQLRHHSELERLT